MSLRSLLLPAAQAARALRASLIHRYWADFISTPMQLDDSPILVVAPHQDDETFGCGGLIALKRKMGAEVTVIFLTDGSSPQHLPLGVTSASLPHIRAQESRNALAQLAVEQRSIHFLNLPDGRLSQLTADAKRAVIGELTNLIAATRAKQVFVTHGCDRLPDHEAAYCLTLQAVIDSGNITELYGYAIWMPWLSALQAMRLCPLRLNIASVLGLKRRATAAYRSQLPTLPRWFTNRFLSPMELIFSLKTAIRK